MGYFARRNRPGFHLSGAPVTGLPLWGVPLAVYGADAVELDADGLVETVRNARAPGIRDMVAAVPLGFEANGWDGRNAKVTFDGSTQYAIDDTALGGELGGEDVGFSIYAAVETVGQSGVLLGLSAIADALPWMAVADYHVEGLRIARATELDPEVVAGTELAPRVRHLLIVRYHGADGDNLCELLVQLPGDDAPVLWASGTLDTGAAEWTAATLGARVRDTVDACWAGALRELIIMRDVTDEASILAYLRARARLNGELGAVGGTFEPVGSSSASAELGGFSADDGFSAATGPELAPGTCLVALFWVPPANGAENLVPWGYCRSGRGWYLHIAQNGMLQLRCPGGSGNMNVARLQHDALNCVVLWVTAGGAVRASVNGRAATQVTASLTYVDNDGTSEHTVGRVSAGVHASGFPFEDGAVLELAELSAEPTDAEARAWSATVFADERYRLPDDVRAHPGLVWCLAASDWDEGATWTSARGSAPLALSADGAPTKSVIPAELIYSEWEACWQGVYHYRSVNLSTGHRIFRRDPFATMRFETEAERIDVEAVVEFGTLNQQGWGSVSARKNAGEVASSLFALDAAGYPQVHRLRLEPGAGTVRLWESLRSGTTGGGMFVRRLRVPATTPLTFAETSAPELRVVWDCDSVAMGEGATNAGATSAYARVMADAADSLAMLGTGGASLFDVARTANQRRNRLDALRVLFRDVTTRVYWFALGTNDYALDRWSAAEFGAALATWLDELHAALPGVHVVIQSPTPRTDESGLNDDDLPAFRAQMEAVADARAEWTTYVDGSTLCDVEFVSSAFPNDVGQLQIYQGLHPVLVGIGVDLPALPAPHPLTSVRTDDTSPGHASLSSWPAAAAGWTLTGWVKLEDLAAVESPYRVMMAARAGTQETISLWAGDDGEIGFFSEPAQNDLILLADHELFDTWLFFEVTKDAGANTGRLRLWSSGGALEGSYTGALGNFENIDNLAVCNIGGSFAANGVTVRNWMVFAGALSEQQVEEQRTSRAPVVEPWAWWLMATEPTWTADSSGNARALTEVDDSVQTVTDLPVELAA